MMRYIFLTIFLPLLLSTSVQAASFFVSPATGSFNTKNTFTVGVYVNSSDQSINAVSGSLTFPKDIVQVVSISKSNSIVNLWVKEPTFSNTAGAITYEGVVLNPGYQGPNGRLLTITFRPKVKGEFALSFTGGQTLANDGKGTDVLKSKQGGQYSLVVPPEVVPPPKEPVVELPVQPELPPAIETLDAPSLIYLSKEIASGNPIVLYGTTYPNSKVEVTVEDQVGRDVKNIVHSDSDGKFSYVHSHILPDGLYQVWAKVIDEKGNKSEDSYKEVINIQPSKITVVKEKVIDYLTLAIVGAGLLLLFLLVLFIIIRLINKLRRRVYKEARYADTVTNSIFLKIKDHIDHIEFLEKESKKKGMVPKEKYLFKQLKKDIQIVKDDIHHELGKIKDIVK